MIEEILYALAEAIILILILAVIIAIPLIVIVLLVKLIKWAWTSGEKNGKRKNKR